MPPATTSPAWPSSTYWAAVAMAFRPDRQTLLTVRAGTVMGIPPRTAACLAVIWPCPAWRTCPMTTCSTAAGSTPARSRAAEIARPPSSTAGSGASAPPNRPMGVLAPAQITGWVPSNMEVPPFAPGVAVSRRGSSILPLVRALRYSILTSHQTKDPAMASPAFPSIGHVALTVRDLSVSVPWYEALLDAKPALDQDTDPDFHHTVSLLGTTLLGLHQHQTPPPARAYSEYRIRLQH